MHHYNLETEILEKVRGLNTSQRFHVLTYIQKIPAASKGSQRHRSKALQQIREALANQ